RGKRPRLRRHAVPCSERRTENGAPASSCRRVPVRCGVRRCPPDRAPRHGHVAPTSTPRRIHGGRRCPSSGAVIETQNVAADVLPESCAALVRDRQARLVVMTGTDERERGRGYGLYYVFALPSGDLVSIEAQVDPVRPEFPAVTRVVPAAHWYEREVKDL